MLDTSFFLYRKKHFFINYTGYMKSKTFPRNRFYTLFGGQFDSLIV